MINIEKFKSIPGFNNYGISEYGEIYSFKRSRIIAIVYNHAGYMTATLTDGHGFRSPRKVHRLVYLTYVGPLKKNMVIDHIDDNKLNNHYTNLQQITASENSIKTFETGKNHAKVIWTRDQIISICEMMEQNIKSSIIFKNIGVHYYLHKTKCNMLIGQLKRGEIHQSIAKDYNISNYVSSINKKDCRFNISEVRNIYLRMLMGEAASNLAKEYDVSYSTICKIRDKKTWKNTTDFVDQYFED